MKLFLILGNQLFNPKYLKEFSGHTFYMAEDFGLCTFQKHHKLKILLFLSSMRSYADGLKNNKFKLNYTKIDSSDFKKDYTKKLESVLKKNKIKEVKSFEIEDKFFETKIKNFLKKQNVKWNILQSEISIGSGGLFGDGFLNSKQNEFNFLPEADTDFIFSIFAEQFGYVGVVIVLFLLTVFVILSMIVVMQQKRLTTDMSPYYLGTYFTFIIGFSFLMNVLMVSGLIPVVGLPLPFFTKGGSSLLCFSIMLGLIFSSRGFLRG